MKYSIPMMSMGTLALAVSLGAHATAASVERRQAPGVSAPVTVEGCLMREDDVPGRKANVAEKLGIGKDFVLTNTKMKKGLPPGAVPGRNDEAVGTGGTSGAMYDLNGIDEETLKRHLNRRVEVDGTFENVDAKGNDLIEIRASAIRAAKGDCQK